MAILITLFLARPVLAQQGYDEDDEEALARQQYEQQQAAQPQQSAQFGYVGAHPIPYDAGSGFCYEQGAHFHEYPPFDQYLFRESGGWFYFVGDPGDFGYTQQTWGYNGNHPIPAAYGGGYCFITWPHRHFYAPSASMSFNFVGGYYVYAGPWDPWYWTWRDRYVGYWGGYYRNSYFGGRYYTVRPPPVYRPRWGWNSPGVYRPGVVVNAPPARGGYVGAPPARITVPPPARGGYVAPPPGRGGSVAPPPARGGYVGSPPPGHTGGGYTGAPPPGHAGSTAPPPGHAGGYTGAPPPAGGSTAPPPRPAPGYTGAPAPAPHYGTPAPAPRPYTGTPAPAPHYGTPAPAPMPRSNYQTPAQPMPHSTAPPPAYRPATPPPPARRPTPPPPAHH